MWIHKINLGLKKSAFVLFFLSVIWLYSPLVSFVAFSVFFFTTLYFLFFYGFFVRRQKFISQGEWHEVRDFFLPKDSAQNYREIITLGKNSDIESRIFTSPSVKKSAYFNIIFEILSARTKLKKAVILGGGGGSVALCLAKKYPQAQIDVVEKSAEMAAIAEKYFLGSSHSFIKQYIIDAAKFLETNNSHYDFIFVDIFNPDIISKKVSDSLFILSLKKRLNKKGIVIINFGPLYSHQSIYLIIQKYISTFKNFRLYIWSGNAVGVVSTQKIPSISTASRVI